MKTIILTLAAACLAACTFRPDMATQRAAIDASNWDAADQPLTVIDIEARQSSSILGLVGINSGARTWASADRRGITEQGGVILRSAGFGHDLMAADASPTLAAFAGQTQSYMRAFRHMTADNQIVASTMTCQMAGPAPDTTTVVGRPRSAQLWTESCTGGEDRFTNRYWREGGETIRTEQWLSGGLGTVIVEFPTD